MILMRIEAGVVQFTDGRSFAVPPKASARSVSPDVWLVARQVNGNYQGVVLHRGETFGQVASRLATFFR